MSSSVNKTWSGYTAIVKKVNDNIVKKIYKPSFKWMLCREIKCLEKLKKYKNFPECHGYNSKLFYMDYCGEKVRGKIPKEYNSQMDDILSALKECKIIHRDIQPKNILINNGTLYLVDFGWALIGDEKETPVVPPKELGGAYYKGTVVWNHEVDIKASRMCI